jgi:hypothetical protein
MLPTPPSAAFAIANAAQRLCRYEANRQFTSKRASRLQLTVIL